MRSMTAILKSTATVLLAIVMIGTLGCGNKSGQKRIVLLNNGNSPFWDAARAGLQDAEKQLKLNEAGYTVLMEVNDGTIEGQINKLRQFASQSDIVAVAVSSLDANNLAVADEMRKLQSRGVKVIAVDADLDRTKFRDARKYYIGTDNLAGGRELGTAARHLARPGGYVQFVGRTGSFNAIERMDGFKQAVGQQFQERDRMGDLMDRTKARDNVRNALRNFPDLTVLVGIWSYNAPAIVDIVKEMNKRDQVTIVTFDAEKLAIDQMGEGYIDAMVVQNPYNMGFQAVRLLKAMLQDDQKTIDEMYPHAGEPDGDIYDTGLKVVVPNKGSPLKREMFGAKTEFLKLDQFKTWLAKYGLTSS